MDGLLEFAGVWLARAYAFYGFALLMSALLFAFVPLLAAAIWTTVSHGRGRQPWPSVQPMRAGGRASPNSRGSASCWVPRRARRHEGAYTVSFTSKGAVMPTITPFLWFNTQAEEAMNLYTSIFRRSKVVSINRVQGKVMSVRFELEGQAFMALNAGPQYTFTEAISLFVGCETQQEIDELWTKLTADGGAPGRCGWLKDKFGLSWQIIPNTLGQMLSDEDAAKSGRVMNAMLQMGRLDLKRLQQAYNGE